MGQNWPTFSNIVPTTGHFSKNVTYDPTRSSGGSSMETSAKDLVSRCILTVVCAILRLFGFEPNFFNFLVIFCPKIGDFGPFLTISGRCVTQVSKKSRKPDQKYIKEYWFWYNST